MEILAIDDDPLLLHTIKMVLEESFGEISALEHPEGISSVLSRSDVKVIILDLNFAVGDSDGSEGLAWIKKIRELRSNVSIVVLTAHGFLDVAVQSMKQGATDFLEKPFSNEKLVATVQAALNLANSKRELANALTSRDSLISQINKYGSMVTGKSPIMQKVMDTVKRVAATEASVLITGEHGTGKEVLARYIHQMSGRAAQALVLADLGAITEGLFESSLFGHVKGAFTDAHEDKAGLMETASLGTLLLDEVGDLPIQLQSKLLTALENREISRVGEHHPRAIDVRIISTSHKSVELLNNPSLFRQDLLFRINTMHIELPPLRHRREDIKPLAAFFLQQFNRKYERTFELRRQQLAEFAEYDWPGNVRELRNTVERMVIMDDSGEFRGNKNTLSEEDNLYELEKKKIEEVIARHAGNISRAASELGIGRNTLYRKMKKYDL